MRMTKVWRYFLQVLHPVCHVRNLMLWSAVYLPSSSPTTPSDDSCAPYPVPGSNSEDTPLARLAWCVSPEHPFFIPHVRQSQVGGRLQLKTPGFSTHLLSLMLTICFAVFQSSLTHNFILFFISNFVVTLLRYLLVTMLHSCFLCG